MNTTNDSKLIQVPTPSNHLLSEINAKDDDSARLVPVQPQLLQVPVPVVSSLSIDSVPTTTGSNCGTTAMALSSDSGTVVSIQTPTRTTNVFWNYIGFTILFSLNHSAGLACMALASNRLGMTIGSIQNGILYFTYTASVLLSSYVVRQYGSKVSIVSGMYMFTWYVIVGCYLPLVLLVETNVKNNDSVDEYSLNSSECLDSIVPSDTNNTYSPTNTTISTLPPDDSIQLITIILAWIGATVGGIGAGICWTGQGVYFIEACDDYYNSRNNFTNESVSNHYNFDETTINEDENHHQYNPKHNPITNVSKTMDTTKMISEQKSKSTKHTAIRNEMSVPHNKSWTDITNNFSTIFACTILLFETILNGISTLMIKTFNLHWSFVFALYSMVAILSTIIFHIYIKSYSTCTTRISSTTTITNSSVIRRFNKIKYIKTEMDQSMSDNDNVSNVNVDSIHKSNDDYETMYSKITAAFRILWTEPRMKYFIAFNMSFGFTGAFLNSFISGEVIPLALDSNDKDETVNMETNSNFDESSSYVGFFVAIHGIVAAIMSIVCNQLFSSKYKGLVHIIGSIAFGCVGFIFLILPNVREWNWNVLVLIYAVQGLGRATFEGNLKSIFADYFHSSNNKEGAFANIILQYGCASSIAYVLLSFDLLSCSVPATPNGKSNYYFCVEYQDGTYHNIGLFAALIVSSSVIAVIGFLRASYLNSLIDMQSESQQQYNLGDNELTRRQSKINVCDTSTVFVGNIYKCQLNIPENEQQVLGTNQGPSTMPTSTQFPKRKIYDYLATKVNDEELSNTDHDSGKSTYLT